MEIFPPNFKSALLDGNFDDIPRGWKNVLCPTFSNHQRYLLLMLQLINEWAKFIPSNR